MRAVARALGRWAPPLALAAGCGDVSAPANPAGSHRIEVRGDLERSLVGEAVFVEEAGSAGGPAWALSLLAGGLLELEGLDVVGRTSLPGADTIAVRFAAVPEELAAGETGAFLVLRPETPGAGGGFVGSAVSGTVVVTTADADRLEGTVRLGVAGLRSTGAGTGVPATVRVTGRFRAVRAERFPLDGG